MVHKSIKVEPTIVTTFQMMDADEACRAGERIMRAPIGVSAATLNTEEYSQLKTVVPDKNYIDYLVQKIEQKKKEYYNNVVKEKLERKELERGGIGPIAWDEKNNSSIEITNEDIMNYSNSILNYVETELKFRWTKYGSNDKLSDDEKKMAKFSDDEKQMAKFFFDILTPTPSVKSEIVRDFIREEAKQIQIRDRTEAKVKAMQNRAKQNMPRRSDPVKNSKKEDFYCAIL